MRASSLLTALFLSVLILFGFLIFSPPSIAFSLQATVDVKPDTLNVNMKGRWITVHLGLPGYNVSDVDTSSIRLEGLFRPEWSKIEDDMLVIKFDAPSVADYLLGRLTHMQVKRTSIDVEVTGQLKDGTQFSGIDTITVMDPPFGH